MKRNSSIISLFITLALAFTTELHAWEIHKDFKHLSPPDRKWFKSDVLETESVFLILAKRETWPRRHFVIGDVIVVKELYETDYWVVDGELVNKVVYEHALLCGNNVHGYFKLRSHYYNQQFRPGQKKSELEIGRVVLKDWAELDLLSPQSWIQPFSGSDDGQRGVLLVNEPPLTSRRTGALERLMLSTCERNGKSIKTNFVIDDGKPIKFLELLVRDLAAEFGSLSFDEWYGKED